MTSDCVNFTQFMQVESKQNRKRYWTGLCKNDTDGNENKLCQMENQLHTCNNNSDECVSVKICGSNLKHRLEECDDKRHFVCQGNKGNEIFSWLIDSMQ